MEKWQISAAIGTIIFLIAGALPVISFYIVNFSLFDLYGLFFGAGFGIAEIAVSISGILITLILYPISVILGFLSFLKQNLAIVAGILGIICWIGAIITIPSAFYGIGIYLGLVGALILIVTKFIR